MNKNEGKESSCAKLFAMPLEEQWETISEIMNNRGDCLQCDDTYLVVDTEVCEDNTRFKSAICLCTSCQDTIEVIFERGTSRIERVKDIK